MTAEIRRWFYLISGVLAACIPIAVQVGVFDTGQADSSTTLLTSLAGLIGGGGALTASAVTHKQIKAGVHDPALDPIDQIAEAIPKVLDQQASANAAVDKLKQITGDLVGSTPIVGVATAAVGGIAQQALDQLLTRSAE